MQTVKHTFRFATIVCCTVLAYVSPLTSARADPVFGAGTFVWICKPTSPSPGEECSTGGGSKFSSDSTAISSQTSLLFGGGSDALDNNQTAASTTGSRNVSSPGAANASGSASADLATGTLKTYATSNGSYFDPLYNDTLPTLLTVSQAGFEDTLTAAEAGTMHFNINVSGTTTLGNPSYVSGGISFWVNGPFLTKPHFYVGTGGEVNHDGCIEANGCEYIFDFPVSIGDAIDFALVLEVDAANGTGDFSHTLLLAVTGVPFTSDSGVFPAQLEPPSPAVPEPATLGLLGLGLAGLGFSRRKQ